MCLSIGALLVTGGAGNIASIAQEASVRQSLPQRREVVVIPQLRDGQFANPSPLLITLYSIPYRSEKPLHQAFVIYSYYARSSRQIKKVPLVIKIERGPTSSKNTQARTRTKSSAIAIDPTANRPVSIRVYEVSNETLQAFLNEHYRRDKSARERITIDRPDKYSAVFDMKSPWGARPFQFEVVNTAFQRGRLP